MSHYRLDPVRAGRFVEGLVDAGINFSTWPITKSLGTNIATQEDGPNSRKLEEEILLRTTGLTPLGATEITLADRL